MKYLLSSIAFLLIFFSGCSDKVTNNYYENGIEELPKLGSISLTSFKAIGYSNDKGILVGFDANGKMSVITNRNVSSPYVISNGIYVCANQYDTSISLPFDQYYIDMDGNTHLIGPRENLDAPKIELKNHLLLLEYMSIYDTINHTLTPFDSSLQSLHVEKAEGNFIAYSGYLFNEFSNRITDLTFTYELEGHSYDDFIPLSSTKFISNGKVVDISTGTETSTSINPNSYIINSSGNGILGVFNGTNSSCPDENGKYILKDVDGNGNSTILETGVCYNNCINNENLMGDDTYIIVNDENNITVTQRDNLSTRVIMDDLDNILSLTYLNGNLFFVAKESKDKVVYGKYEISTNTRTEYITDLKLSMLVGI